MKRLAPLAVIGAVLLATFGYTVEVRRPDADVLSYGHHEWLTAHALKFARTWWQEGAFKLDFLMMEMPLDIEHPTMASRQIYPSYPPGAVLAPYLAAKVLAVEPSVAFLMAFNRALHLFIALCLSLGVWLLISPRQHPTSRALSGLLPGLAYLLLPGPMFWQQNVYFTDTAVMAPFALLLLAIAMDGTVKQPWPRALTAFAFFWGFGTDWFFVSIALVWGVVRLAVLLATKAEGTWPRKLAREFGGGVLAALLSFGFFAWQLTGHSLWQSWRAKLSLRTGGTGDGAEGLNSNFNDVVWGYVRDQYGQAGRVLLFVIFGFALAHLVWSLRRRSAVRGQANDEALRQTTFISVAALAPLLHTYLLRNHSYLHDFSVLKFAIPLACIPFALLPQVIAALIPKPRAVGMFLIAALTCSGLVYTQQLHLRYPSLVPARNPEIAKMGSFVTREATWDDVLFSDFVKAEPYPAEPHLLSHTLKLIHQVSSVEQLEALVENLPAKANVVWFGDETRPEAPMGGAPLWSVAHRSSDGPYYLLRLSREVFLNRLQGERVAQP